MEIVTPVTRLLVIEFRVFKLHAWPISSNADQQTLALHHADTRLTSRDRGLAAASVRRINQKPIVNQPSAEDIA